MKILLFMQQEYIFPADYSEISKKFNEQGGNVGNKVFGNSIYDFLASSKNEISFCIFDQDFKILNYTVDEICEKFDCIVIPALILGLDSQLIRNVNCYYDSLKNVKIPIFCFGCTVQIGLSESMSLLVDNTKESTSRFVNMVINGGGDITLRGYFTAEYMNYLGYKNLSVLGCPSLYQAGPQLKINKKSIIKKDDAIVVNGNINTLRNREFKRIFKQYENSFYIDQDLFVSLIYGENVENKIKNYKNFIEYLRNYSSTGIRLFANDRLVLICDFDEWKEFLISKRVSFSLGERIHGNIISILAGIPACVFCADTRTKEIAEFYNIPFVDKKEKYRFTIDRLYEKIDYTDFNSAYSEKYDTFIKYLVEHNLIDCDWYNFKKSNYNFQDFNDFINSDNKAFFYQLKYLNYKSYKVLNDVLDKRWYIITDGGHR